MMWRLACGRLRQLMAAAPSLCVVAARCGKAKGQLSVSASSISFTADDNTVDIRLCDVASVAVGTNFIPELNISLVDGSVASFTRVKQIHQVAELITRLVSSGGELPATALALAESIGGGDHAVGATSSNTPVTDGAVESKFTDDDVALVLEASPFVTRGKRTWKPRDLIASVAALDLGIDIGDKVILPSSVLEDALAAEMELPLQICIAPVSSADTDAALRQYVYGGVHDFTAAPGAMYVPSWMLANMGCAVNEHVRVVVAPATLSGGQHVLIQPQSTKWIEISEDSREALLLDQLTMYQTLTSGTSIPLQLGGERLEVAIIATEPEAAVSIVNANLETEVLPLGWDASSSTTVPQPAPSTTVTVNGESVGGRVDAETTQFYSFNVDAASVADGGDGGVGISESAAHEYVVAVECGTGRVALYASQTSQAPSAAWHSYRCVDSGVSELVIPVSSLYPNKRTVHVGVSAFGSEPAEYSLRVSSVLSLRMEGDGSGDGGELRDGHVRCEKCGASVRQAVIELHQANCSRADERISVCEQCGSRVFDAEMHAALMHGSSSCSRCDWAGEIGELPTHNETNCPQRLVACSMCSLELTADSLDSHSQRCGTRSALCDSCGARLLRRDLADHACPSL